MRKAYQLNQGFDFYEVKRERAAKQNERIFEWLDANAHERFFLFVNYMDAHRPYNTRERLGLLDHPLDERRGLLNQLVRETLPGKPPPPAELVERVTDQYDTGIAHADEALGHLLDSLKERGLLEDSLVIVTADHGEYLGEHGLVEHSKDVYQAATHVPLLIKAPGQTRAARVSSPVSSARVPALLFDALGGETGRALRERLPGRGKQTATLIENYYSRSKDVVNPVWGARFRRVRRALLHWPHKLIQSSDGAHELYDLSRDPGETSDLREREPELARALVDELEALLAEPPHHTHPAPERGEIGKEEQAELRALGYSE